MAAPSVTYTFSNSTTADATQVNQNFTDIINGITDGTKDLSIAALTVAGNASFSGNVTLGNASADDILFTGSLAGSIPIKTTNTYDIGSSTLGLRALYFGANSQTVNIKGSASMSATWTFTLPVTAGSSGQHLRTDGAGVSSWVTTVGAWASFTPTGSWSTNTTYTGFKRQVGENYEYDIRVATSGAPTSANLSITIPDTIDTTKMTAVAGGDSPVLGFGTVVDAGVAVYQAWVYYLTTTTVRVTVMQTGGTYGLQSTGIVSQAVPMTFGAGDYVSVKFTAPISGLSV